ncbi:MAG: DUF3795 domain-containing protein [Chloroflexi bacterium]|nr:DUF3795 domain-containing protein [Chloroflexota bacterium]
MAEQTRVIAKCGLVCSTCPAYVATQTNDLEAKRKIAAEWSSPEHPLVAEELFCDGCGAGGRILSFCHACEAYTCATEHAVANCAHCADYGCDKIQRVWSNLGGGEAKAELDAIRARLA